MRRRILFAVSFLTLLFCGGWDWNAFFSKDYATFRGTVKSIASKKNLPALAKPEKPKELKLITAKYGTKDKWIDVTDQLKRKINENSISNFPQLE